MLLFLGAGASKAVGIGDLEDLSRKVNEELATQGYGNVLDDIVDVLNRANTNAQFFNEGEIDLEVTLSILNARTNHISALKESGPYSRQVITPHNSHKFPTNIDVVKIKRIVSGIITDSCIKYDESKALEYYGDLFDLKDVVTSYRNATQNIKGPAMFENIVTTNYDLVVDNYFTRTDKPLNRGFEQDERSPDKILNLRRIQTQSTEDEIQYVQLHGSIDWWLRERYNQIVQRESRII